MVKKSFSYGEVLGFGWNVMTSNFWFYAGILIVTFLISALGQMVQQILMLLGITSLFLTIASSLVSFVIDTLLTIGLIKISLTFADDIRPKFSLLFDGLDCFWRYLGTVLLYSLITLGAFIVCSSPLILYAYLNSVRPPASFTWSVIIAAYIIALVLAIKFGLGFYFVVDKGLGPIKALKASNRATTGAKLSLFGFGIVCFLIYILGFLFLFFSTFMGSLKAVLTGFLFSIASLFVTVPMIMVAMALVYKKLSGQTPELAEVGINGPPTNTIDAAQVNAGIQAGLCIRIGAGEEDQSSTSSAVKPASSENSFNKTEPTEENAAVGLSVRLSEEHPTSRYTQPSEAPPSEAPPSETQPSHVQPSKTQFVETLPVKAPHKEKSNKVLWMVIILLIMGILSAVGALVGLGFHYRNEVNVPLIHPKVAINGILYSEDAPSVIIEGKILKEGEMLDKVKVIKIEKGVVEFEKEGRRWKQKL